MADTAYPSESEQEEAKKEFEEQFPNKYVWGQQNSGIITAYFESPWKDAVTAVLSAGDSDSAQYQALIAIVKVENGYTEQQVSDIKYSRKTANRDGYGFSYDHIDQLDKYARADLDEDNKNVPFTEVLEREYKEAMVAHVFEESGVISTLESNLQNDKVSFAECAEQYRQEAETLMLGIDEFWKVEAVNNMFEPGWSAAALRATIVNPGQIPTIQNYVVAPTSDASAVMSSIFRDSPEVSGYGYTTTGIVQGEPLEPGGTAGVGVVGGVIANFDDSDLLLQNIDSQSNLLKYPDTLSFDSQGNYVDANGNIIDPEKAKNFPFHWAGMIINYVRVATFIASRAPTSAEVASLQQPGDPAGAEATISGKNHGVNEASIYNANWRDSPNAVFNSGITYLLPGNSVIVENFNRNAGDRLGNSEAYIADENITIAGLYSHIQTALSKLKNSGAALSDVTAINSKLSDLNNNLVKLQEFSNCLKKAHDNIKEEFEKAQEAMAEFIDDGFLGRFFKDSARNAAIADAIAAIDNISATAYIDRAAERVLFREQCFLLSYVATIAGHKKNYLDNVVGGRPQAGSLHKRMPYWPGDFPLLYGGTQNANGQPPTGLYNACLQIDGDAYGFINKLTQSPNYASFFEIDNWMLSYLQPKIRLFKVEYDEEGNETEVEISFESHFSANEMTLFKDAKSRGVGVGLKSFTFTYDGSNPFAAKKSIKANLKIFANSFNELFVTRKGEGGTISDLGTATISDQLYDYKYADLALKTFSREKVPGLTVSEYQKRVNEDANKAKLNFRLKAVVGWSEPKHGNIAGPSTPGYTNQNIKAAIKESFVTLNLTPTVHTFDFDDQGRVVMDINYLAYVEDFFDERAFNVFSDPSGENGMNRIKRELKAKKYTRECTNTESDDPEVPSETQALNNLKAEYAQQAGREKRIALQSIINALVEAKRIHFVAIPLESVRRFTSMGPFISYDSLVTPPEFGTDTTESLKIVTSDQQAQYVKDKIDQAISTAEDVAGEEFDQDAQNAIAASLVAVDPNEHYLSFFYLSDLVDIVLSNIERELEYLKERAPEELTKPEFILKIDEDDRKEKIADLNKYLKNLRRFRIILGPVELANPISDTGQFETTFVNFGDLPISVKYFAEFLASKTLKNDNTVYSLPRFLNDLMNNLVNNFLNSKSCFNFDISQKVRVNQNVLTSYAHQYTGGDTEDEITNLLKQKSKKLKNRNFSRGSPTRLSLTDDVTKFPIINVSGYSGGEQEYAPLSHEINYFTFFAARTQPADLMNGDRLQDQSRGIFHYMLGKDSGIVKNIKLQKTQTPGLQEVRFEQEGYDGLEQLRVVYDVEIDCYANINAFPGTYIYIPPEGFDPSANFEMTKFGIGGYYMIYRSSHNFAAGEATTKIYAKWVAQVEAEARKELQSNSNTLTEVSKCKLERRGEPK